ncbi:hypothetical protein Hanom_Chr03g00266431 [Helianthus anomalus]
MHHVVAFIAERQKGTCTNRSLSRLLSVMCLMFKAQCKTTIEPRVSLETTSLFLWGRCKTVYILPFLDSTLALLLVGFTEYDDDDGVPRLRECNYSKYNT